jgi:hypothetical protein
MKVKYLTFAFSGLAGAAVKETINHVPGKETIIDIPIIAVARSRAASIVSRNFDGL